MNRVGVILLDFYRYIMYNMVMLVECKAQNNPKELYNTY